MLSTLLIAVCLCQDPAPPGATIEGRVLDARGEPIPVAQVWVTSSPGPDVLARTVADGEGCFRLGRVPARSAWTVHASAPGRITDTAYVSPDGPTATLRLYDAGTIRGTFVDRAGQPIAGAQVVAAFDLARIMFSAKVEAITDENGAFTLAGVPLGVIDVRACKAGAGFGAEQVHLRDAAAVKLQVGTDASTTLRVVITGLPADAERPRVSLLPYTNGSLQTLPRGMVGGTIGADGSLVFEGLPDWEYLVRPSSPGFTFAPRDMRVKEKDSHDIAFTAHALGTMPWSGRCVDAEGQPVAGLRLAIRETSERQRAEAVTGADGRFTLQSHLAPGTKCSLYSLDPAWCMDQAKTEGMYGGWDLRYLNRHEAVVAPDQPLELRVAPATVVTGRVVRDDGRPVPFARIELEHARGNRMPWWMAFASATTDREGRFALRGLHGTPDPVRVKVEDSSGAAEGEPFQLGMGEQIELPPLKLAPAGSIGGIVRDAQGGPVPGARVWLRTWDFVTKQQKDGGVTEVVTDREGRYRFVGVGAGGYYLQVTLREEHPMTQAVEPFELPAGEMRTFDLSIDL